MLDILFIEKKKGMLQFKVYFMDTSFKIMSNMQLREQYPQKLIEFYENNIHVSFKWSPNISILFTEFYIKIALKFILFNYK